jgi:uncharacterized protein (DUF362 family)
VKNRSSDERTLSRRDFIRAMGVAAAGTLIGGCRSREPAEVRGPVSEIVADTPSPTPEPTATAVASVPSSRVAIAHAVSYDRKLVQQQVRDLLDALGGLGDVVRPGDRVAIKVNLTGGTTVKPLVGVSAVDSYITHPQVVRALGELVRDAGAGEIYIVEAVYEWDSYRLWGYEEVAEAIDATLIDLNDTRPYSDFASTPVGEGWFIYKDFYFNHILEEVDAFISVAKMKCHWSCGVTHAMKNLIGLVPARLYRLSPDHNHRSAFHGAEDEFGTRLPKVIMDLNRARPIHLALIDGIKTAEGGEGPWIETLAAVEPGVLIAGKDPVATDAVATAAMGFDPITNPPASPFVRSDNHLNLACDLGLGTNRLDGIEVVGPSIGDVRYEFEPCWE